MAIRYQIVSPTANGSYTLPFDMSADYERCYATIRFFNDSSMATQATPTAGTVKVTLSPDGVNYYTMDNGSFNAADAYLESRAKPSASSIAVQGMVTYAGVAGANHAVLTFERF
jgi:hypothetical protein